MRFTRSKEETDTTTRDRDATTTQRTGRESGSWFSRAKAKYGLGAVLVAIGAVLFVIPEPMTSTAGIGLMVVGGLIWLVSLVR